MVLAHFAPTTCGAAQLGPHRHRNAALLLENWAVAAPPRIVIWMSSVRCSRLYTDRNTWVTLKPWLANKHSIRPVLSAEFEVSVQL